ncbi:unnamed protein product, partial [Amoebophrya sp. A25]|eukprot:GSA25T00026167001.1
MFEQEGHTHTGTVVTRSVSSPFLASRSRGGGQEGVDDSRGGQGLQVGGSSASSADRHRPTARAVER